MHDKVSRIRTIFLSSNTTMTIKEFPDKKFGHKRLVSDFTLPSDVEVTPLLVHYDKELDRILICLFNHSMVSMVIIPGSIICQLQACKMVNMDIITQTNMEVNYDNCNCNYT